MKEQWAYEIFAGMISEDHLVLEGNQMKIMLGRLLLSSLFLILVGCASVPEHTVLAQTQYEPDCDHPVTSDTEKGMATSRVSLDPPYTLHYLEFDDQGWEYPATSYRSTDKDSPSSPMDFAIKNLAKSVETRNVATFVYVHGWHHSAKECDRDVKRFKELLAEQAKIDKKREVIGFYIGWNGDSIDIPILENANFWGRKNAAHHVSEGSVREFFARMKALRGHWNRQGSAERVKDCGAPSAETSATDCPIKTVMIGHSFGAWILYASTAPYLIETLSETVDVPKNAQRPVSVREHGIADLVILLNPAFEASRYESLHRIARQYKRDFYSPPLLVSITSQADLATKNAFPIARFFNTIFQYPSTSDEEAVAMKHTHGHIDDYLTHDLTLDANTKSNADLKCSEYSDLVGTSERLRTEFFSPKIDGSRQLTLDKGWTRKMCSGLVLKQREVSDLGPYNIVWNIRTFSEIIAGHNDIVGDELKDFVRELYMDLARAPRVRIKQ